MKIYGLTVNPALRFKIVVGTFACAFHTAKNKTDHGREILATGNLHNGRFWEGRSYSGVDKIGNIMYSYLLASVDPQDRPKDFGAISRILKSHGEDVLQPARKDVDAGVYERVYVMKDIGELLSLCRNYKE